MRPLAVPVPWHRDVVYEIFPATFKDGDGDGIGDLKGIVSEVETLHDLGIDTVWLTPIYPSSHHDSGYDVKDYTGVDPQFGTLEDFRALVEALHDRGMKLMMDMVVNHSSDEHPWFRQELRRKALQKVLTQLVRTSSRALREELANLVADPESMPISPAPELLTAQAALDAYEQEDDHGAIAAGYLSHAETRRSLSGLLAGCADDQKTCMPLTMPFDDFYIWQARPNNWDSWFSGSAWRHEPAVGGYCLHLFSEHQLDLNWRNPRLRQAIGKVATVWRERGVDGFRLDAIGVLAKDPTYPRTPGGGRGLRFYTNLPDVHRYIREVASHFGEGTRSIGELPVTYPAAAEEYAGSSRHELGELFEFDHLMVDFAPDKWHTKPFSLPLFKDKIALQQRAVGNGAWLGNFLENHDNPRIVSRFGDDGVYRAESAKLFASLLMTLAGSPYIYQGQELGMTNLDANVVHSIADIEDIEAVNFYQAEIARGADPQTTLQQVARRSRDHARSAMQWSHGPQAGFTAGVAKVPINRNHQAVNIADQMADPNSVWRYYQRLIKQRDSHPEWLTGAFQDLLPQDPHLFVYLRTVEDRRSWVALNFSSQPAEVDICAARWFSGASDEVVSSAKNSRQGDRLALAPWGVYILSGAPRQGS